MKLGSLGCMRSATKFTVPASPKIKTFVVKNFILKNSDGIQEFRIVTLLFFY